MLLGLSSADEDAELVGDLTIDIVGGDADGDDPDGGVAAGAVLTRFAEAIHAASTASSSGSGSDGDLDVARSAVVDAVGDAGMVDAAAICANFNMMVRIADGTGTPLDAGTVDPSADLRAKLGLDDLTSRRVANPTS
ncbi:MAG: hypothetical protein ACR2QO_04125 [Acidimicrobiales bacterium]